MRKILITGGAGFIASSLAEKLIEDDDNFVIIVDDLSTGHVKKLPVEKKENWKFIKCDVNNRRDISEIMMAYRFDFVFHYAAVVGVQKTLMHPLLVLQDVEGIKNILTLSKNTGVQRIYFSSSSEIYGEPVEYPQNEYTTPLNSRLPYAIVKNLGEAFLKAYQQEFGLDYTIFRFFNTYGPKQSRHFVISKFLISALNNEDITVYGDGKQTRTFCFIDDNIETCISAFNNSKLINDVANIGSNIETTIYELAQTVIRLTGSKSKIVHLPPLKEGDMSGRLPDTRKMRAILNKPLIPLETGIKNILDNGLFEMKHNL
ncbi:MAG: epimerase [Bacteroidetes bacterium GWF2_38_335]|nr:MAG: epimerase [Bacteroidetes bacterium GWF2_38_335]OFY81304.1 MAG: epimerase [Bacteroidetes bacterium RIFOXYA12_FULL_38_20]HBS85424.1 epimerase [Bacteroidales bacterium]